MFNLLVGRPFGGALPKERVFEGTQPEVRAHLRATGDELRALLELPTLAMPEIQSDDDQVARVGKITRVASSGRDYIVTFEQNPHIAPIPTAEVRAMIHKLDISNIWALNRTYLTVKDIDLYRTLLERDSDDNVVRPSQKYLKFPNNQPEPDLVAVMMPFEEESKAVYNTI